MSGYLVAYRFNFKIFAFKSFDKLLQAEILFLLMPSSFLGISPFPQILQSSFFSSVNSFSVELQGI